MSERLQGKTAVITGGGNGIGRACALRFAQEGADVVVADVLAESAHETAALIEAHGTRAASITLEAGSRTDNEAMAALAIERFGRLDVVVTAAGISHHNYRSGDVERDVKMALERSQRASEPGRNFVDTDIEEWNRVIEVNLTGTFLAMQACVSRMLDTGNGGSIITIASIAAKQPKAGPLAYTVSKAGVWMLTKKAALELAPAGIRVNAIGPGYINTNMTQLFQHAPDARQKEMLASIPMARLGQPAEIASVALFLASDDASYMTGEILHPDGGFYTE